MGQSLSVVPNHWLYQLANFFLYSFLCLFVFAFLQSFHFGCSVVSLLSYIQINVLYLRVVLALGSLCYVLWCGLVIDVLDGMIWNLVFTLVNAVHIALLVRENDVRSSSCLVAFGAVVPSFSVLAVPFSPVLCCCVSLHRPIQFTSEV